MPSLWKAWIPLHGTHTSHNDLEKPAAFPHSHKADDGFLYIVHKKLKKSGVHF